MLQRPQPLVTEAADPCGRAAALCVRLQSYVSEAATLCPQVVIAVMLASFGMAGRDSRRCALRSGCCRPVYTSFSPRSRGCNQMQYAHTSRRACSPLPSRLQPHMQSLQVHRRPAAGGERRHRVQLPHRDATGVRWHQQPCTCLPHQGRAAAPTKAGARRWQLRARCCQGCPSCHGRRGRHPLGTLHTVRIQLRGHSVQCVLQHTPCPRAYRKKPCTLSFNTCAHFPFARC